MNYFSNFLFTFFATFFIIIIIIIGVCCIYQLYGSCADGVKGKENEKKVINLIFFNKTNILIFNIC